MTFYKNKNNKKFNPEIRKNSRKENKQLTFVIKTQGKMIWSGCCT